MIRSEDPPPGTIATSFSNALALLTLACLFASIRGRRGSAIGSLADPRNARSRAGSGHISEQSRRDYHQGR